MKTSVAIVLTSMLGAPMAWAACPDPGATQITIYKDSNYRGDCKVLNIGNYPNPSSFGLANDAISSLKVGTSVRAVLFKDSNYGSEQSLYESGSYTVVGRNENDQTSSIIVSSNGGTRAAFRYLGSDPSHMSGRWATEAQGLAHDGSAWYVTQRDHIWRYSLGANLASAAALDDTGIPWQLSSKGCDHFGDPDVVNGYLFVPVEGCYQQAVNCGDGLKNHNTTVYLAVFDSQLNLVCYDDLYKQEGGPCATNAAWVAADPTTGYLYSSDHALNASAPLRGYWLDWSAIYPDDEPHWFLYDAPDRALYRQNGTSVDLRNIQGGVYSPDGLFYLSSGSAECGSGPNGADLGGLRVFRSDGTLIAKAGNGYGYFQYENHCGFYDYEEPEGLDWVDMNAWGGSYDGQLHAILLQNGSEDDVYLKHYDRH
jgi:hypothetical protein